ncbi:hypothetical protein EXN66_Car009808 [Channa argus]|uniref:Uncharacterized protein n=1 Tax=Channa argus TaxID=215402 RepID=A0A6G1PV37_CHAAH|nr:hypothetical protein EXN66_Car009808 [Channa argus]
MKTHWFILHQRLIGGKLPKLREEMKKQLRERQSTLTSVCLRKNNKPNNGFSNSKQNSII